MMMTTTEKHSHALARSLTNPQKFLLLAMARADEELRSKAGRLHHVHDLGFKLPVLRRLVRGGLVEHGSVYARSFEWRGRLTSKGRALARYLCRP